MGDEELHAHYADVENDLHLETWETAGHYFWKVTNTKTHAQLGAGEAGDSNAAKVAAAGVAGVQWKSLIWRGIGI